MHRSDFFSSNTNTCINWINQYQLDCMYWINNTDSIVESINHIPQLMADAEGIHLDLNSFPDFATQNVTN